MCVNFRRGCVFMWLSIFVLLLSEIEKRKHWKIAFPCILQVCINDYMCMYVFYKRLKRPQSCFDCFCFDIGVLLLLLPAAAAAAALTLPSVICLLLLLALPCWTYARGCQLFHSIVRVAKGICRKLGFVSLPTAAAAAAAAAVASAYVINNQHVSVCRRYARAPMLTRAAQNALDQKKKTMALRQLW